MAPTTAIAVFAAVASAEETQVCNDCDADSNTLLQTSNIAARAGRQEKSGTNSPPGWLHHNNDWNCAGRGSGNHDSAHNGVGSLADCAELCANDGHEIAALWGDGREICRCYDECEDGGPTHVPEWTNTVVRQDSAPSGWSEIERNWNCGGRGQGNHEEQHAVGNLADCAEACADYRFATLWWNDREICRCYNECDNGGPTHMPEWPNTVMTQELVPSGWTQHNVNWNCAGRGQGNHEEEHSTGTLAECAEACSGFQFAALWWNNRNLCRCYNDCEEGGATHMPDYPNTVMAQSGAPSGWIEFEHNWNCGGRGQGNHEEKHAVASLAECAEACADFRFAGQWWNGREICRCYNECDNGGPTHMPTWPSTVIAKVLPEPDAPDTVGAAW